jgi:3-phenylpropionate/trans-cinnamate dioxygenase ferredoxin component
VVSEVDVGALADFADGAAAQVRALDRVLVLVRLGGDVYVLDDRCSHEEFWLSEGEVDAESREIECARHGSMFSLIDGAPTSLPATRPVARYDARVVDGRVKVVVA